MKTAVIIPASGSGQRFGGTVPKQFLPLGGKPILWHTLTLCSGLPFVDTIIVAVLEAYVADVTNYRIPKVDMVIAGAATRAESIYKALQLVEADFVIVHDAIRPFATSALMSAVHAAALADNAAIAAVPSTDTIKQVNNLQITQTLDRANLYAAQTPQVFKTGILKVSYAAAFNENVLQSATDCASLVERAGYAVKIVLGETSNIKITTSIDMKVAEVLRGEILQTPATPTINIYTDGACQGNPGPGGWGAVLTRGDYRKEISGYDPDTTNNRMELMGPIEALRLLKKPSHVVITSDSKYVVDAIEKGWAKKWQSNGWMRTKTEEAKNSDLWEILLNLLGLHSVQFEWVKGHAGHTENERCDFLANEAIRNGRIT